MNEAFRHLVEAVQLLWWNQVTTEELEVLYSAATTAVSCHNNTTYNIIYLKEMVHLVC